MVYTKLSLLCPSCLYCQCLVQRCGVCFYRFTRCSSKGYWIAQFKSNVLLLLLLLPLGFQAQAIDYTFSDSATAIDLPAGCSIVNSGFYSCGALTLGANDTINIGQPKPAVINFTGAVTLGAGVYFNAGGNTADLSVVVDGAVTLGANSTLIANLETLNAGAVTIGADSWISGDLSTQTGFVKIGAATIPTPPTPAAPQTGVGGNVSSITGYVSMGADSVINGSVETQSAGYVVLGARAKVGKGVSTLGSGYVVLGASAEVNGSIAVSGTTGADYASTGAGSIVRGNITTVGSYIVLGANTTVKGNISTQISYISVGASCTVDGEIAMNDPTPSYIGIGASSKVYAVCCNEKDASCVSGKPLETLVCQTPTDYSVAESFDCLEADANLTWDKTTRKPLYTKLASTPFSIDIVALKADQTLEEDYFGNVTMDLVDGSTDQCSSLNAISSSPQQIDLTFVESDGGRKTSGDVLVTQAYSSLRCRLTDSSQDPSVVSCSTDRFSVRPSAITLVTTANAEAPLVTSIPKIKAGANFGLSATTSLGLNYGGTLLRDDSKLGANLTSVGNLSVASLNANSDFINATYSEAGYLYLSAGAYRDESYTSVDSEVSDCLTDTIDDKNLSDKLVGAQTKYGCHIGNNDVMSLGRFIPHHFEVVLIDGDCGKGGDVTACSNGFTYSRQPLNLTITAKNSLSVTMVNYDRASFAKMVTLSDVNASKSSGSFTSIVSADDFTSGVGNPTSIAFIFNNVRTMPSAITIRALDADNVSSEDIIEPKSTDGYETSASTKIVSGRVKLVSSSGSELKDLSIPMRLEYWESFTKDWQPHSADSATEATVSFNDVDLNDSISVDDTCVLESIDFPGSSNKGCSTASDEVAKQYKEKNDLVEGDFNLWLQAPRVDLITGVAKTGAIDITAAVANWLKFNWTDEETKTNPKARVIFGIYSSNPSHLIHRTELY